MFSRLRAVRLTPILLLALSASCGGDDDTGGGTGNPAGVGNRCTKDADCATNQCYLGPGGGYCTTTCADEGNTAQCPIDTVCKPIQGGPRRCLLVCGSSSTCGETSCPMDHCPRGSSCVSISNSNLKACEPDPS
jgi:hypothetical protein